MNCHVPVFRAAAGALNQTRNQSYVKTQLTWMGSLVALAAGTSLLIGAEATLKVGDPAPKLQTGKWVQGEPVKQFDKDHAYIVEFWATWCGPCRASIPHLNEIHKKFQDKGLIVIGQDCWEKDESKVAPFVKETMGDKMTYRVALDDKSDNETGKMAQTWMAAAGQNGIPTAFLIDKQGKIAWIGHPMAIKEKVIEDVLAGTYDVKKAAAEYDKEHKEQAAVNSTWMAINRAMQKKDWDTAMAKVDEAEKVLPEPQRANLDMVRLAILFGKEDYPAAYKLAAKVSDAQPDNAMLQNQLAWQIATDKSIKQRDLDLAEKMAQRAVKASDSKDAASLDTLARVTFMKGDKEKAVSLQEKAVELADGDLKTELQKNLDSYRKGELSKAD